MRNLSSEFIEKIKKIKLVIMDVDGVLTDGGLYYSSDGLIIKKFNVKDGMGAVLLKQKGIICGIMSTDVSPIITQRGERLKLDFTYIGIWNKKQKMLDLCDEYGIEAENVAFIGDDVNDLEIIGSVGVSACPADAVDEVLNKAEYICSKRGGDGAFRELAEIILKNQNIDED
ncbi:MAG: HAD hydrolase family protein [bacterium]